MKAEGSAMEGVPWRSEDDGRGVCNEVEDEKMMSEEDEGEDEKKKMRLKIRR